MSVDQKLSSLFLVPGARSGSVTVPPRGQASSLPACTEGVLCTLRACVMGYFIFLDGTFHIVGSAWLVIDL